MLPTPLVFSPNSVRPSGFRTVRRSWDRAIRECGSYEPRALADPCERFTHFDPLRVAILLVGGDKTGADRWYETFVALADRIYDEHLRELRKEDKL